MALKQDNALVVSEGREITTNPIMRGSDDLPERRRVAA
jgi:hypothetical protein